LRKIPNSKKGGLEMKKMGKKPVRAKKPIKRDLAAELKRGMTKLKRESNAKIRELETQVVELNRLREEVDYKNRQLAAKDTEMETYKKMAEEKIFQLEAKVKELALKARGSFPVS
jgi:hypothetical protein